MEPNSAHDILYIVLALATVWITVFLCWLLYQAGRAVQNINRIIEHLTGTLETIAGAVEFIRRRMDGMSNSIGGLATMAGKMAEKFIFKKVAKKMAESEEGDRDEEIVLKKRRKK